MEEKRTAVVTGAAGGMGQAVVKKLSSAGWEVWSLDRADLTTPRYIKTDITDMASVEKACARIKEKAGKINAIVHLAGIYDMNSLVEMSEEDFVRIFNVNLFGIYRVNKALCPLLAPSSRIVIISSELAPLDPLPFNGIYGITKTAIEKYAYSLRMELQLLGHKVIVVRPGAVKTGLLDTSKKRIEAFCESTELYKTNAKLFMGVTEKVETRNVTPDRIGAAVLKALEAGRPRYLYNVNRNFLLRLFNALPQHLQTFIMRKVLS